MKTVEIIPQKLGGIIEIPPSKSISHRAIICGALAEGTTVIHNILCSDDIQATCKAMEILGAHIEYKETSEKRYTLTISGITNLEAKGKTIDCAESGSTLRFIIPIMALNAKDSTVTGRGRLVKRPMEPYYSIFDQLKIHYKHEKEGQDLPLTFSGKLQSGIFQLKGEISSQFITGLLLALPLIQGDSVIEMITPLESKPYVDITLDMMKKFGVSIENFNYEKFVIKGNQYYKACECCVEGDYSQGAFWLVGGILGKKTVCKDLLKDSKQGDKAIVDIIKKMNGIISNVQNVYTTEPCKTKGRIIDVSQYPDLVPILAVLSALSDGKTEIINAARLRYKESDRLMAMTEALTILGAKITEHKTGLTIEGTMCLKGGKVDSHNDHRIAMAIAIASFACSDPVTIIGSECVRKSYPDFWKDFKKMGGIINEFDLGE
ncbi:MAG: 3-phosphoshikimate 1-carboxyvinyltransferase [Eubacterium sp.]